MLNLSIMPLDAEHVEEISEDIINQQRRGVSSHALFMMKFNPEGTPPVDKASEQCKRYDLFRERLNKAGAKHGVLVQATLGHITVPFEPYPFEPSVSLVDGSQRVVTACPLDPKLREHMKGQMRTLAKHSPSIVMIDDDVGLFYKPTKGCACKYHMAEFCRRAGVYMTREELYRHTLGSSAEDKKYTDIYVGVVRDSLVDFVKAMRAGLDEVDPTIQGIVSGIYTSTFLEFSDDVARAFAGEKNPAVARLNGGPYAKPGTKNFTAQLYRAAIIKENSKGKIDRFLAETDTCPQNRYSTSAAYLHSHFTASILEGATGAKHWITRLSSFEPSSGVAYRKKLSKYSAFYRKLIGYASELSPFGCRIPLSVEQDFGFIEAKQPLNLAPWASTFLERIGVPLYFSNEEGGTVFLDDISADGFSDDEIRGFMKERLVLSAMAAKSLALRGFLPDIGVEVRDHSGAVISGEMVGGHFLPSQYEARELVIRDERVERLSEVIHKDDGSGEITKLFPGVTRFKNTLGGETVVFSGNPDAPFKYYTSFSLLNETRKRQLVSILTNGTSLPLYYPEDAEVYIRSGYLSPREIMVAFFNLGHDELDDIPLEVSFEIKKIEVLLPSGEREERSFSKTKNTVRINETLPGVTPLIIFLHV